MIQAQFGVHLFKSPILFFEFLQPFDIGCLHATVLRLPVVVRGIRDAVLPAKVFHLRACIRFFKGRDDLRLGESGSFHLESPDSSSCQKTPISTCRSKGEAYGARAPDASNHRLLFELRAPPLGYESPGNEVGGSTEGAPVRSAQPLLDQVCLCRTIFPIQRQRLIHHNQNLPFTPSPTQMWC